MAGLLITCSSLAPASSGERKWALKLPLWAQWGASSQNNRCGNPMASKAETMRPSFAAFISDSRPLAHIATEASMRLAFTNAANNAVNSDTRRGASALSRSVACHIGASSQWKTRQPARSKPRAQSRKTDRALVPG